MTVYQLIVDRPLTQAELQTTFELHAKLERNGEYDQFLWFRWTFEDAQSEVLDRATEMRLASMALHAAQEWQNGDQDDRPDGGPSYRLELRPGFDPAVPLVRRYRNEERYLIGEWSDWRASDLRRHVIVAMLEADDAGTDLTYALAHSLVAAQVTEGDRQRVLKWLHRQQLVDGILETAADGSYYVFEVDVLLPTAYEWTAAQTTTEPVVQNESNGVPYALSSEQFSDVLNTIRTHQDSAERLPGAGPDASAGEDAHRDNLLSALRIKYSDGTAESFSKRGKTDIRVVVADNATFYAECKIWSGPSTVDEALEQLLHRYLIHRDRYAALVFFVRNRQSPNELPQKAIDRLTDAHAGVRQADVAGFPVVRVAVSSDPVDLALIFITVDQAKR